MSWNCSIQIVLRKITKMKRKTKMKKKRKINKTNFMNDSFFSLLFFSSHRYPDTVINPIWVGIVPVRSFWLSELKWKEKRKWKKKDKRIKQIFIWMLRFRFLLFFFLLTDMSVNSSMQFELEWFQSDCFEKAN